MLAKSIFLTFCSALSKSACWGIFFVKETIAESTILLLKQRNKTYHFSFVPIRSVLVKRFGSLRDGFVLTFKQLSNHGTIRTSFLCIFLKENLLIDVLITFFCFIVSKYPYFCLKLVIFGWKQLDFMSFWSPKILVIFDSSKSCVLNIMIVQFL